MKKTINRIRHDIMTIEIVANSKFISSDRKIKRIKELVEDLKLTMDFISQEEKKKDVRSNGISQRPVQSQVKHG